MHGGIRFISLGINLLNWTLFSQIKISNEFENVDLKKACFRKKKILGGEPKHIWYQDIISRYLISGVSSWGVLISAKFQNVWYQECQIETFFDVRGVIFKLFDIRGLPFRPFDIRGIISTINFYILDIRKSSATCFHMLNVRRILLRRVLNILDVRAVICVLDILGFTSLILRCVFKILDVRGVILRRVFNNWMSGVLQSVSNISGVISLFYDMFFKTLDVRSIILRCVFNILSVRRVISRRVFHTLYVRDIILFCFSRILGVRSVMSRGFFNTCGGSFHNVFLRRFMSELSFHDAFLTCLVSGMTSHDVFPHIRYQE